MVSIEKEGRNVEVAISNGLEQLGVEREEVIIEVIKEGGLFSKAKVRLTVKATPADELCEYVEGLLRYMGLDCSCVVVEKEGTLYCDISGKDSPIAIGYRGEVLSAIQYLATIYLNRNNKSNLKLIVDVEGYRDRRRQTLILLAKRLADKAIASGSAVDLEPMNTIDRRSIHEALAEDDRVTTESKGDEPNRYVSIVPKEKEISYGTSNSFKKSGFKTRSFGQKKKRF